jgi:hypothetical protein
MSIPPVCRICPVDPVFVERVCKLALQDAPSTMEARHHRPDRDTQDLRRVLIAEVTDVDQHDHVAEVVRDLGERRDDVVLRQRSTTFSSSLGPPSDSASLS